MVKHGMWNAFTIFPCGSWHHENIVNFVITEMCLLSNNIHDYHFVSQGKTTIPNVDDAEEMSATDVSYSIKCSDLEPCVNRWWS